MAQEKEMITLKSAELRAEIENVQEKGGHDSLSDATKDVLRTGLREMQSPLLARFRERALVLGEMLATFALIFLAAGTVSQSIPYSEGLRMAIVLLAFSVAIPGGVEMARVIDGSNELGEALHEVRP